MQHRKKIPRPHLIKQSSLTSKIKMLFYQNKYVATSSDVAAQTGHSIESCSSILTKLFNNGFLNKDNDILTAKGGFYYMYNENYTG